MNDRLLSVTYERCRSAKGVPLAHVPLAMETLALAEPQCMEYAIVIAVEFLQAAAADAHPGEPSMHMPTLAPTAYYLGDHAGAVYGTLAECPWMPPSGQLQFGAGPVARVVLWDKQAPV